MDTLDQPEIRLAPLAQVVDEAGIAEGQFPERGSGHAAALQEGLNLGSECG